MTVFDNVGFGLKMKHIDKKEIKKRVKEVLNLVELDGFEDRYPNQLSGGQQQRVAIARGIIMNPKVLLLDESLGSLDLKLKRTMQIELKKIQKKLGITFIYVTHNQDEALTMSDRIVIINEGTIGESNILPGKIVELKENKSKVLITKNLSFEINRDLQDKINDKVSIIIRPENINLSINPLKNSIKGTVDDIIYDGAISKLFINTQDDLKLKVTIPGNYKLKEKDEIYLKLDKEVLIPIRRKNNE